MTLHPSLQSILSWLQLPTEIEDCYKLLGLSFGASLVEIEVSYQHLTQRYNLDINLGEQQAKDKLTAVTEAYRILISVAQPTQTNNEKLSCREPSKIQNASEQVPLLEFEEQLKWLSYYNLQQFLNYQQFPKAIALVEGLAQRLPHDAQVSQWQASAYQRWGRQLLSEGQLKKARIYLRKALKTDPHNRDLWLAVEQDFRLLEQML